MKRRTFLKYSALATGVTIVPRCAVARSGQTPMEAYQRPERTLPRVANHHRDGTDAIRAGQPAGSNFDYGGALTELALLGLIAVRYPDTQLQWDGPAIRLINHEEANRWLRPSYREGWTL